MRSKHVFVLALSLCAYADVQSIAAPTTATATAPAPTLAYAQPSHTSMPPRRLADCVTYALLDNKCTADWYKCSDNGVKGRCMREWNDCCTLPGNPARTTIVSSPQTP